MNYELIICIVNAGYSELVMDAAKEEGEDIKDKVLHALYKSAGLKSEGQGIAFSMPVSHVVGLTAAPPVAAEEPSEENKQ